MHINADHVFCKNRFDIQVQLLSMLPRTTGTEKQFPSLKGSEQTGFTGTSWGGMPATTQEDGANHWVKKQNVVRQMRKVLFQKISNLLLQNLLISF